MVREAAHPTAGRIPLIGFPYKLSRTPPAIHQPPPCLGEHNREVLIELLGYSEEQVEEFQETGVI
jgi:crotonobetainyl-CoA:carnitine CoA-transferase CaiB-like acyl-CoA transferase